VLGAEPQIKETYVKTGQVRLIFNPVLSHGSYSEQSHLGAECAAEQGRFWEMHHLLFENQDALWGDTQAVVKELVAELGLDTEKFNACLDEQRYSDLIFAQDEVRQAQGIWGQPVLDINGERLFGAQSFEKFQEVIETKLTEQ
jgi:protein-disulfide isomerase